MLRKTNGSSKDECRTSVELWHSSRNDSSYQRAEPSRRSVGRLRSLVPASPWLSRCRGRRWLPAPSNDSRVREDALYTVPHL